MTDASPGDRVAHSPGNEFLDVKQFGVLIKERALHGFCGWEVIWDELGEGWVNSEFIQVVRTEERG